MLIDVFSLLNAKNVCLHNLSLMPEHKSYSPLKRTMLNPLDVKTLKLCNTLILQKLEFRPPLEILVHCYLLHIRACLGRYLIVLKASFNKKTGMLSVKDTFYRHEVLYSVSLSDSSSSVRMDKDF